MGEVPAVMPESMYPAAVLVPVKVLFAVRSGTAVTAIPESPTPVAEDHLVRSPVVIAPEIEASVAEIAVLRFASVGVSSQVCTPVPSEESPVPPLAIGSTL